MELQESRLFKILYYLLEKGRTTAPELAKRFEVSVRTIYRDMDALSESGIPVYAESGRNGGICLLDSFVLDKTVLSDNEKQEILASLQSLSVVGGTYDKNMLTKLSALFQIDSEDWLEADFSRWGEQTRDNEKFEDIKKAVIGRKSIKIQYEGSCYGGSERIVYPLKLKYKAKEWYLKAFCTQKQDFRLFKLTRIIEWEVLEETFKPMEFPAYEEEIAQKENVIVLRFAREMAYRVYDEFDRNQVTRLENGDLEVVANMPENEWLIGYLLSFGTKVDVVQPEYFREVLSKRAKEIYEKNKS